MASGILLASGQNFVLDMFKTYLDASGAYVGLMQESATPTEESNLPSSSGITEVTGAGYTRQAVSTWTKYNDGGINPYIQGDTSTFTVSGDWNNVNGYFVCLSLTGNDALWAESFPVNTQANLASGDYVMITPKYEQKYYGEI